MRSYCVYAVLYVFFNDTATTEIYTLSLHDALPIYGLVLDVNGVGYLVAATPSALRRADGDAEVTVETYLHVREDALQLYGLDRKSTRLNSSHANISYAVFCLKKKKHKNLTVLPNSI